MIIGVDECNFSPSLAGDCIVCSLFARERVEGVGDSKKIPKKRQLELFAELQSKSIYSVVPATVNAINIEGVYVARNRAIASSVGMLLMELKDQGIECEDIIIDGYWSQKWLQRLSLGWGHNYFAKGLIRGDSKVYEISAASIVARVYADALFEGWNAFYPDYRLNRNHGSPDQVMYAKIRESGPCPIHRTNYGKKWWNLIMRGSSGS